MNRQAKLEIFFKEVSWLCMNHGVLRNAAVISAWDLSRALEKVDPEWFDKPRLKPSDIKKPIYDKGLPKKTLKAKVSLEDVVCHLLKMGRRKKT